MTINVFGGGNTGGPAFPVQRSVRLRSSASAYFRRTPASATNQTVWTLSAWVKRGALGSIQTIFDAYTNGSNASSISFTAADQLQVSNYVAASLVTNKVTTQVFRDPSAWYHIVVASNGSTSLNIYVNGTQVTSFATNVGPTAANWFFNGANIHNIGTESSGGSLTQLLDGYLTEINWIDGQALTPSSFGSINSTTGVWQPIKYNSTYGANGFYLNFQDNSAATAAAIGKDSSGNGNNWTPNNISVTAGVTYDSMLDVPTLTSAANANFAVMNPLNKNASGITVLDGNLGISTSVSNVGVAGTIGVSTGKWYWETTFTNASGTPSIGAGTATWDKSYVGYIGSIGYHANGIIYNNGTNVQSGLASYTSGDVIGVALDMGAGSITFYKNNVQQGTTVTGITGEWFPAVAGQVSSTLAVNFGQRPFTYTPPSGFKSLNTYNLPAPTIPNGAAQFAATTYTGNGGTQSITNTVNGKSFQPDLVWVKARSVAYNNYLEDSVRGVGKDLSSNLTDAEATYNLLTSFNSNGFTVFTNGTYLASNQNGTTYVGWQWKASNAAPVTNTSGSITSSVSANPTAGFSIVTYTGTGANATVGHGLGIAPKMVIIKARNQSGVAYSWVVWQSALTGTEYLLLNSTAAKGTAATVWNSSIPTSTVINLGTDATLNGNTVTYVAYCFSEIAGYSKFGSYTGNGSTDGPFVYLGFRPRFILAKRTDTVSDWWLYDTSRNTYNVISTPLFADLSNAEGNNAVYNLDLLSNGFKWRTADTTMNGSGGTYIYAAFAESPFNYSLAR